MIMEKTPELEFEELVKELDDFSDSAPGGV